MDACTESFALYYGGSIRHIPHFFRCHGALCRISHPAYQTGYFGFGMPLKNIAPLYATDQLSENADVNFLPHRKNNFFFIP